MVICKNQCLLFSPVLFCNRHVAFVNGRHAPITQERYSGGVFGSLPEGIQ